MNLNERAHRRCQQLIAESTALRVAPQQLANGATVIDLGVRARGGLEAGRQLAEICLSDLGRVGFAPGDPALWRGAAVVVATDQPVLACMASQYAGWQVSVGKYFAMGSGPMRAAAVKEPLFAKIGFAERPTQVVGVLESHKLPTEEVVDYLASQCQVPSANVTLLVAPTASQAGTVQVVARSVETALHKLFELGFDLSRVESGWGTAPLPPVAADDLAGIGRTNDAMLYGGEVTLWVRGDDESLEAIGPQVPSCASADFGEPFGAIFKRYNRDFYKIDPHLFSPASITLINNDTGRSFHFGETRPDIVERSFRG